MTPDIDFQNFSEKMTISISLTRKILLQTAIRLKKVSFEGILILVLMGNYEPNEILIIFVNFSKPIIAKLKAIYDHELHTLFPSEMK